MSEVDTIYDTFRKQKAYHDPIVRRLFDELVDKYYEVQEELVVAESAVNKTWLRAKIDKAIKENEKYRGLSCI